MPDYFDCYEAAEAAARDIIDYDITYSDIAELDEMPTIFEGGRNV